MPRIVRVEPKPTFRLFLRFEDGIEGEVDLSSLAGKGVFASWKSPGFFEKVSIDPETGTVAWPGGIDLCPENLYHDLTGAPLPGAAQLTR